MLKRYTYYIIGCLCLALAGCDNMSEAERLIYEPPYEKQDESPDDKEKEVTQRIVLLEDFTGQRCTNCPKATDVIEQLQEALGDVLVPVGIHGGPLGFMGNAKTVGLATETGNEYYNHWGLQYQPVGLVGRHGAVDYPEWTDAVKKELAKPAPLRLAGTAVLDENDIAIQVTAEGTDGTVTGMLQVWVVEDGISALQMMPDGPANQAYIHNHVFRAAVNGTWGEDFSIKEGDTWQHTMTQAVDPKWNPAQLSIVAFVYNDSGVQQTAKFQVKTP